MAAEPSARTEQRPHQTFGALLRAQRRIAGLTQAALAARAGVGVRSIRYLEAHHVQPSHATAEALAAALDLDAAARAAFLGAGAARSAAAGPRSRRPRGTPPTNLPAQLTSFVGREQDTASVAGLLQTRRLVTLTGTAGCGKTRLALQVAAEALPTFGDGAWLVELAALGDPALVSPAAATAVGVREALGRDLLATLADALCPRRLLLVLDNCEHLVAACARLADALLRACPQLTVLATSREPLGVVGETVYAVAPLDVPDLPDVPDASAPTWAAALVRYGAVRLFVDRAQAARPGFQLTDANAPSVARLCARLDGLPLAIELAAARLPALAVEQIADRLDDRFHLLTGGSRTALPRHQTLLAALDWSFDLLDGPERAVFRRLAVFARGCTLEGAEAVCAGGGAAAPAVLDVLTRLVAKSLVLAVEHDGAVRYRLLETLRQYAREQLVASGELAAVQGRHARFILTWAEQTEAALRGPHEAAYLDSMERDHENVRAALDWSAQRGGAEEALRLVRAVGPFWLVRGHLQEGWARVEQVLALPGTGGTRLRATVLRGAAGLAWAQGDYAAERRLIEAALACYRAAGDAAGSVEALGYLARAAFDRGDYADARDFAVQALAPQRALPWPAPFLPLAILAHVARDLGECETARTLYGENLALARAAGDGRRTGHLLYGMGWLAYHEGDFDAARARLQESLDLREALGQRPDAAVARTALGHIAAAAGDRAAAGALLTESLPIHLEAGDRYGVVLALEGCAALAAGRPAGALRAARLAGAAAALRAAIGRPRAPADQPRQARTLDRARAALAPAAFAAAYAEGEAMSSPDAVAYALAATSADTADAVSGRAIRAKGHGQHPMRDASRGGIRGRSFDAAPAAGLASERAPRPPLSPREWEVATLVAQGLTNREIAAALVVTERTVVSHVEHIMARLGMRSRVQIGIWAVQHAAAVGAVG